MSAWEHCRWCQESTAGCCSSHSPMIVERVEVRVRQPNTAPHVVVEIVTNEWRGRP